MARFPEWATWRPELQKEVIEEGLRPVGTEAVDGLIVTTFVKNDDLTARWFYVVPERLGAEERWFRVIAMNTEYCFYSPYPMGLEPVMEKLKDKPVDPMEVVKRICRKRK